MGKAWKWVDPVTWLSWVYFHLFLVLSSPIRKHQELRADGWSALAFGGEFAAQTLLKDWLLERQFNETLARFLHTLPRTTSPKSPNVFRDFADQFHDLTPEGHGYLERRLSEEERGSFFGILILLCANGWTTCVAIQTGRSMSRYRRGCSCLISTLWSRCCSKSGSTTISCDSRPRGLGFPSANFPHELAKLLRESTCLGQCDSLAEFCRFSIMPPQQSGKWRFH